MYKKFIAALFIIPPKWNTQIAYQQYEWINKSSYIHTILYDNDNKPIKAINHNLDLSHRDVE